MPTLLIEIIDGVAIEGVMPDCAFEAAYAAQLRAANAFLPLRWRVAGGALPPDWDIDEETGLVTGSGDDPGYYEVTIELVDGHGRYARRTFRFRVIAAPLVITGSAPDGAVEDPYSYTYTISGGIPPYFPILLKSALPSGLALTPGPGADQATISGTPEEAVDPAKVFTVAATDSQVPTPAFATLVDSIAIQNFSTHNIKTEAGQVIETEGGNTWRLE